MLIIACNGRRLILLPLCFLTSWPASRTVVSQRGVADACKGPIICCEGPMVVGKGVVTV